MWVTWEAKADWDARCARLDEARSAVTEAQRDVRRWGSHHPVLWLIWLAAAPARALAITVGSARFWLGRLLGLFVLPWLLLAHVDAVGVS